MPRHQTLNIGDTFHELTIIAEFRASYNTRRLYSVRCSCGGESVATIYNLTSGKTKACGPCAQKIRLKICREQSEQRKREGLRVNQYEPDQGLVDAAVIEAITRGYRDRDSIAKATGYNAEAVADALGRLVFERIRMRIVNGIQGWYLNEFSTTPKGVISNSTERFLVGHSSSDVHLPNFARESGLEDPFSPATYSIAGIAGQAQYHGPDSRRLAR